MYFSLFLNQRLIFFSCRVVLLQPSGLYTCSLCVQLIHYSPNKLCELRHNEIHGGGLFFSTLWRFWYLIICSGIFYFIVKRLPNCDFSLCLLSVTLQVHSLLNLSTPKRLMVESNVHPCYEIGRGWTFQRCITNWTCPLAITEDSWVQVLTLFNLQRSTLRMKYHQIAKEKDNKPNCDLAMGWFSMNISELILQRKKEGFIHCKR